MILIKLESNFFEIALRHGSFLKNTSGWLLLVLADCINKSFETVTFPECLKEANITPIFKQFDPLDKKNYLPVNIFSLYFKIFEKLIYKQIYREFCEFCTFWFSKGSRYSICFIQVTLFLAKRGRPKRICGYSFNGFIQSMSLYLTRPFNSQIGMLWIR